MPFEKVTDYNDNRGPADTVGRSYRITPMDAYKPPTLKTERVVKPVKCCPTCAEAKSCEDKCRWGVFDGEAWRCIQCGPCNAEVKGKIS